MAPSAPLNAVLPICSSSSASSSEDDDLSSGSCSSSSSTSCCSSPDSKNIINAAITAADLLLELPQPSALVKPPHPRSDAEALRLIDALTRLADQVQVHTLSAILHRNAGTEYLAKFGLAGRTDRHTFKSLLPVIIYEDLQPEIQRIANGDTSPILSSCPISEFLTSSGTSAGERKLMPTIHDEFERRCLLYSFLMPIMNQYVADLDKGKGMYFYFIKSEMKTPGGLVARPVLTSYYKSHWFTQRPHDPYNVTTSPNETVLCPDSYQSMYCQMLCGLLQRDEVLRMGAVFASGFLRAIRFLQEHWQELCRDIASGEISDSVTDEPARRSVQLLLDASPATDRRLTADSIAHICSACQLSASWKGIIPLIWPRTKYIDVIVTGAMAQYIPTLDFYSSGLPLVCTMYASSECYFGVNLHPLSKPSDVSYTLIPNMAYFEFLPIHTRTPDSHTGSPPLEQTPQLVDLVDVQLGREYELVVTTHAGLYRYRVGDVLRVTGFHNAAPQFQFVCRKNAALSIDSDKTDEETLHRAVEAATSKKLQKEVAGRNLRLLEYTSFVDSSTIPGHYVLFWELQEVEVDIEAGVNYMNEGLGESGCDAGRQRLEAAFESQKQEQLVEVLAECCAEIERNLDAVYRQGRTSCGTIGPLEIRLVKSGTFDQLMDYALSRGSSINQYKAPRVVKSAEIIQLMDARVTLSVVSPRLPPFRHQV